MQKTGSAAAKTQTEQSIVTGRREIEREKERERQYWGREWEKREFQLELNIANVMLVELVESLSTKSQTAALITH